MSPTEKRIDNLSHAIFSTLDPDTCVATIRALQRKGLDIPDCPPALPSNPNSDNLTRRIRSISSQLTPAVK